MSGREKEFARYLRAVRRPGDAVVGEHLGLETLIEYHQSHLARAERERVQSHLAPCAACTGMLKDVSRFFQAVPVEAEIGERQLDRKWSALWPRVERIAAPVVRGPGQFQTAFWEHRRVLFALAAGLLVAFGALGIWSVGLRQENRRLREQISAARPSTRPPDPGQSGLEERVKSLEQENRRLQDRVETMERRHESQLARLRQPDVNAPIYDLLPVESIARSGGRRQATLIQVPPSTRTFVVILHWRGERDYPNYGLELIDRRGRVVWRSEGLRPNSDGSFVVTLDRAFVGAGERRLKLKGQSGAQWSPLAEYVVAVQ